MYGADALRAEDGARLGVGVQADAERGDVLREQFAAHARELARHQPAVAREQVHLHAVLGEREHNGRRDLLHEDGLGTKLVLERLLAHQVIRTLAIRRLVHDHDVGHVAQ